MDIEKVWRNVQRCAGEEFYTVTGISYVYEVCGNCLIVKDRIGARITKTSLEKALAIKNPILEDLKVAGIKRANSYIYGIITDERIR